VPPPRLARIERARKGLRVVARRVDRRLQVEAEVKVAEQHLQCPLVLLIAARRTEREIWRHRRGRRASATAVVRGRLPGLERVRQPFLEPETSVHACRGRSLARESPARPRASRRSASQRPCCPSGRRRRCAAVSPRVGSPTPGATGALPTGVASRGSRPSGEPGEARPTTRHRRARAVRRRTHARERLHRHVVEVGVAIPRFEVGESELCASVTVWMYAALA